MALHFPLLLNNHSIGYFYAQRIDGDGTPDSIGTYRLEIEQGLERWQGEVHHRYGDGAWTLIAKAIELMQADLRLRAKTHEQAFAQNLLSEEDTRKMMGLLP